MTASAFSRATRRLVAALFAATMVGAAIVPQALALDAPPSAPALSVPGVSGCTPFGLQLSWSASSDDIDVDRYDVMIARPGQAPQVAASVDAGMPQPAGYSAFVDGSGPFVLYDGETYAVTIIAVDSSAQGTTSNQQAATMPAAAPPPVAGLQGQLTGVQVPLKWSGQPAACAFSVSRDGEQIAVLPAGSTAYVDGLALHGVSTYAIRALGRTGASGAPSTIVVTEPLPSLSAQPTCRWRDTTISARRLVEVSIASVCLVNYQRVRAGLQPVWVDARLQAAAAAHARDEAARNFFDHGDPDGCSPSCRAQRAGYPQGAGENILAGGRTANETVDGWMRSPGHRSNILGSGYRTMGSGTAIGGPYGTQWVHDFGGLAAPISAVSGLESQYQGSANPDAGSSGGTGDSASSPTKSSAKLHVSSARLSKSWRLRITSTVTRLANGGRVKFRVSGHGHTQTYTTRITSGRARLNRTLPRSVRARRMTITVSYGGSRRVRSGKVTLHFF